MRRLVLGAGCGLFIERPRMGGTGTPPPPTDPNVWEASGDAGEVEIMKMPTPETMSATGGENQIIIGG